MKSDRDFREGRRRVAELLEQTAEVVRLSQFSQAVEAMEFATEMVKRLADDATKAGGGTGGEANGGDALRS